MAKTDKDITQSIDNLAYALKALGLNGACTNMGAIEVLAMEIKEGSTRIADAITGLAEAIREHGEA